MPVWDSSGESRMRPPNVVGNLIASVTNTLMTALRNNVDLDLSREEFRHSRISFSQFGEDLAILRWLDDCLVSVRKHFESFESFVIQSGDLIRERHHRCGRRRTADVTTAANCDIRVT